jgi:carbonic anhydrase
LFDAEKIFHWSLGGRRGDDTFAAAGTVSIPSAGRRSTTWTDGVFGPDEKDCQSHPGCHSLHTRVLHLFTLSLFAAAAFADDECPSRLSYWGYSGPAQWPSFPIPDNQCGGTKQSPIDLVTQTPTQGPVIHVSYFVGTATIRNTGHDIEVKPASNNNKIKIGDKVFTLVKFHFHVPSEHHIDGAEKPAEMHIVHQRVEGGKIYYAVIGVMLTSGGTYPALEPVFANLPETACAPPKALRINFKALLPENLSVYYTYAGSLTTPPCTENVTWYVLDTTREIEALDLFKLRAFGENARPVQNNQPPLPVTYVRPQ